MSQDISRCEVCKRYPALLQQNRLPPGICWYSISASLAPSVVCAPCNHGFVNSVKVLSDQPLFHSCVGCLLFWQGRNLRLSISTGNLCGFTDFNYKNAALMFKPLPTLIIPSTSMMINQLKGLKNIGLESVSLSSNVGVAFVSARVSVVRGHSTMCLPVSSGVLP